MFGIRVFSAVGMSQLWSGLAHKGGRSEAVLRGGRHLFGDVFALPWGEDGIAVLRLKAVRTCEDKLSLERTIKVVPLVGVSGVRIRRRNFGGFFARHAPRFLRELERAR